MIFVILSEQFSFPHFRTNCTGLHYRHDDGVFAPEVSVLSKVSDSQIPVVQKERRLLPGKTWWNFGKEKKSKRR